MTITLDFGWWLIPTILTVVFFGIAISKFSRGGGDYDFSPVFNLLMLLLAAVPALFVWLIWALVF